MSSFKEPNLLVGKVSGADLSTHQHKFGDQDSSGDIVLAGAGAGMGVIMNNPVSGQFVELAFIGGGALIESAATIAANIEIASDAAGLAVAAGIGDKVLGISMAASVAGDVFEIISTFYDKHA